MRSYHFIENITEAEKFTDDLLKNIRYDYNKKVVKPELENRLNAKLDVFNEKNNKITLSELEGKINELSSLLEDRSNYITYTKIINHKYPFLRKKDGRYVFNLNEIYFRSSPVDFLNAIEEITGTIYQNSIIRNLNKLNQLEYLKSINKPFESKTSINNIFSKVILYTKKKFIFYFLLSNHFINISNHISFSKTYIYKVFISTNYFIIDIGSFNFVIRICSSIFSVILRKLQEKLR